MKRPLVNVALFYLAGLLLARFLPWPPPLPALFLGSFALVIAAFVWPAARPRLLELALIFAGWLNLASWMMVVSPNDLRVLSESRAELVSIRATIAEAPVLRFYERDERELWRANTLLEVHAVRRGDKWEPAHGRVASMTPGVPGKEFFRGQEVLVTGVLQSPRNAVAEGLFDYEYYLRWQGIHFQFRAEGTNDWRLVSPENANRRPPWPDRFTEWAQRVLARGLPEQDESLRLIWAMTLGWRTALTDEVSEPFMRSGTMHIFAISGLHIALIAGILLQVLLVVRVPRAACGLIIVPLIWFYTAATGWQASAIRSTIMMTIIIGGWSLRRPTDLINSLAGAGFIILLWQPQQLFQASFQLSFFVVLSLALLLPPFEQWRMRLLQHDPFLPDELRPRWRRWLDTPLRWVTTAFATSLAAWIGSLPLIAFYFHLFTPGSLIANMLVVPASALALMCNLGSLFCGDWLPWLGELFNHSGWFWMRGMIVMSEWATTLPGAFTYVRSPTALEFFIYYGGVFAALNFPFLQRESRWCWAAGLTLALLTLAWLWQWSSHRRETRITVLDGAPAILVNRPGTREDLLLDSGSDSGAQFVVVPFLRAQGINRLPALALTHGDLPHVGGARRVVKQMGVRQVAVSTARFLSPAYREVVKQLEKQPNVRKKIQRGDSLLGWEVLHPSAEDKFSQADDSALVLRADIHGTRVLLLSDLGKAGQRALLEREKNLRADIVIAGVPRQSEPLLDVLLDAIQPAVIIVQAGDFPVSQRAPSALRERLAKRGTPVTYATDDGSLTITIKPSGWEVRSMNKTVAAGQRPGAR
ncbi:MAG: ComEC/Rec2 family competence protein [Verrucomicrobia bacterium]|nr:ComEC/Rec2 family competence protein [Verrucomicrobiota bacterium]